MRPARRINLLSHWDQSSFSPKVSSQPKASFLYPLKVAILSQFALIIWNSKTTQAACCFRQRFKKNTSTTSYCQQAEDSAVIAWTIELPSMGCLAELPLFVLSASLLRCRTAWEKNYLTDLWHRYFRNFLRVCRLDHHSPCWRPM